VANAALVKQHTSEIGDVYKQPVIALEKRTQAHNDLIEAMDIADRLKTEGIEAAREDIVKLRQLTDALVQRNGGLTEQKERRRRWRRSPGFLRREIFPSEGWPFNCPGITRAEEVRLMALHIARGIPFVLLLLAGLLALAVVACSRDEATQPTPGGPTPTPSRQTVEVIAPIDNVEVRMAESHPVQYSLYVVSGLPNGCIKFDRYELDRQGNTINVRVFNSAPADNTVACTMVYGMVEYNIPLGTDFVSGTEYTVMVNNVKKTFTPSATQTPRTLQVGVNQLFSLRVGQYVELAEAQMLLTIERVSNDSRCPVDVTCIRAGDATIEVAVQRTGGQPQAIRLVVGPENPGAETAQLGGYAMTAQDLAPMPVSTRQIAQNEYVATLVVRANEH